MNDLDHLVAVRHSAGKPLVSVFMWVILLTSTQMWLYDRGPVQKQLVITLEVLKWPPHMSVQWTIHRIHQNKPNRCICCQYLGARNRKTPSEVLWPCFKGPDLFWCHKGDSQNIRQMDLMLWPLCIIPLQQFRSRKTCRLHPGPQFSSNKALITYLQSNTHLFQLLYSVADRQICSQLQDISSPSVPLPGPWDSNISISRSRLGKTNGCIVVELFIMYIAFKAVKPMDCGFLFCFSPLINSS